MSLFIESLCLDVFFFLRRFHWFQSNYSMTIACLIQLMLLNTLSKALRIIENLQHHQQSRVTWKSPWRNYNQPTKYEQTDGHLASKLNISFGKRNLKNKKTDPSNEILRLSTRKKNQQEWKVFFTRFSFSFSVVFFF